jgi:hypothetical protein
MHQPGKGLEVLPSEPVGRVEKELRFRHNARVAGPKQEVGDQTQPTTGIDIVPKPD